MHVVKEYGLLEAKMENSQDVMTGFSEKWLRDKPKPEVIIPDNARTFQSQEMHEFCFNMGIHLAFPAQKESWTHGLIEAAIKDAKTTANAIMIDQPTLSPKVVLMLACAALTNSTEQTKGYSAFQWCYGKDYSISD